MQTLAQLTLNGIINAALFAMLGIGFGIVYRTTRVFYIAIGGVCTLAVYTLYLFHEKFHASFTVSIAAGITVAIFAGWLMDVVLYRPLYRRGARDGVVLLTSIGAYIIIENVISMCFGNDVKVFFDLSNPSLHIGFITITRLQIIQLITGAVLISAFAFLTVRIKILKALWAMGDKPELIEVMGLPLYALRTFVFCISSLFAAVCAILTGLEGGMTPQSGMSALLIGMVVALVGGLESYRGWILGGIVLAELQSIIRWKLSGRWADVTAFAFLILVLLVRPGGLLSTKKRAEEK
jgi:branched-chain amino acid transport system permease protein